MAAARDCRDVWFLLPEGMGVFDAEFRKGALVRAAELGIHRIRLVDEKGAAAAIRAQRDPAVGRLGLACRICDAGVMAEVRKLGIPCVLLGVDEERLWRSQSKEPVSVASVNHTAVGVLAAQYLLGKSRFRSFAFVRAVSRPDWREWSDKRCQGFVLGLRQGGYGSCIRNFSVLGRSPSEEYAVFLAGLREMAKPVALFCCNDRAAQEVSVFCRVGRIRVPEQVAILGVDDELAICQNTPVALSSIRVDRQLLGRRALDRVVALLRGAPAENVTLWSPPLEVVERDSTRSLTFRNRCVARAVRCIDGADVPETSIKRILAACGGVSRSYLERHFKTETGETLHGYMEHAALDWVACRLLETDCSATALAERVGYSSLSYLCTKFRARFGVATQEYRQRHQESKTSIANRPEK